MARDPKKGKERPGEATPTGPASGGIPTGTPASPPADTEGRGGKKRRGTPAAVEQAGERSLEFLVEEGFLKPAFDKAERDDPETYREIMWFGKRNPDQLRLVVGVTTSLIDLLGRSKLTDSMRKKKWAELLTEGWSHMPVLVTKFVQTRPVAPEPRRKPTMLEIPVILVRLFLGLRAGDILPFTLPEMPDWAKEIINWVKPEIGVGQSSFLEGLTESEQERIFQLVLGAPPDLRENAARMVRTSTRIESLQRMASLLPPYPWDLPEKTAAQRSAKRQAEDEYLDRWERAQAIFNENVRLFMVSSPAVLALRSTATTIGRGAADVPEIYRDARARVGDDLEYEDFREVRQDPLVHIGRILHDLFRYGRLHH